MGEKPTAPAHALRAWMGEAAPCDHAGAVGAPPRVLVAEDDHEMRALLATVLARAGFEVSLARDGRELIELVDAAAREDGAPPDLIVSDVRMPGRTGLEALAELRARLAHTAVLIITAFGDDAVHAEATRLGAAGVLDKPFDLEDLSRAALDLVRGRR